MSQDNNPTPWDLSYMIKDGARVPFTLRVKLYRQAVRLLGAKANCNDEQEMMVGNHHRAIHTAERVLLKMARKAKKDVGRGVDPEKAWDDFWSFHNLVHNLVYFQNNEQAKPEQKERQAA